MDNVLQQLGTDCIFLPHITHKVMENWMFSTNTFKPALKKLCEKDSDNWDKYINQVLASYYVTPDLATAETSFFLLYGRDANFPLHQLLEPMKQFLDDPDSGHLYLKSHHLTLAIAKKTLDENRFKYTKNNKLHPT